MRKIPDFIMNGSATLVSTWVQLREKGFLKYLKMVEFCAANGIRPPMCMVALANDFAIYGCGTQEFLDYCSIAYSTFSECNSNKQLKMVCNIYSAIITGKINGKLEDKIHSIAEACLKEKIPRKVRDFANNPSAAGLDAAFKAAWRA